MGLNIKNADALWVIGNSSSTLPENMPDFISWPPKGFVIQSLVFSRWSFSIPNGDLSQAEISMKVSNRDLSLQKEEYKTGYGDNTVVWIPQGVEINLTEEIKYDISITNVKVGSETKSYNYSVTLVKP